MEEPNSSVSRVQVNNDDYRMTIQFLSFAIFIAHYVLTIHDVNSLTSTGLIYWLSVISVNLDREVGEVFVKIVKIWLAAVFIFLFLVFVLQAEKLNLDILLTNIWCKCIIGILFSLNVFLFIFTHQPMKSLFVDRMIKDLESEEEQ
ncbi:hypothetical protein [Weissella paramesenteroides]|uniref:hypothetical protein n=1 Tax=Weissella paramesenteroides TaxID=1249 RepID=UPI00123B9543|nr:hypothetical protein [Weissella paramesenteroides]KAA8455256.1 hypothetical protein FKV86_08130 [Weissella paramesenteroides]KAA8456283.1 hypothetical protein FKV78_08395 [Weissella paramesenteroides]KAA8458226.1 hypothetical protein FKV82_07290 [Weissella paramesenteroides]KAA8460217.1 hypothetical protein FKV80_09020 [Weissella paramesenteroides]KAA8461559.1 hypothetical protein FKV85_08000 [Weissella paramesenteroides]